MEIGDPFVDDRLVDERPERFGGLKLWRVSWQEDQADAFGDRQIRFAVPAGIVEDKNDDAIASGAGFLRNMPSSASKNGFDTPLETCQKHSSAAGETKAVT